MTVTQNGKIHVLSYFTHKNTSKASEIKNKINDTMKESCPLILNLLYNTCPVKQQNKGCSQALPTVRTTSKENCVSNNVTKEGTSLWL
jgi:hypothetical protein